MVKKRGGQVGPVAAGPMKDSTVRYNTSDTGYIIIVCGKGDHNRWGLRYLKVGKVSYCTK